MICERCGYTTGDFSRDHEFELCDECKVYLDHYYRDGQHEELYEDRRAEQLFNAELAIAIDKTEKNILKVCDSLIEGLQVDRHGRDVMKWKKHILLLLLMTVQELVHGDQCLHCALALRLNRIINTSTKCSLCVWEKTNGACSNGDSLWRLIFDDLATLKKLIEQYEAPEPTSTNTGFTEAFNERLIDSEV